MLSWSFPFPQCYSANRTDFGTTGTFWEPRCISSTARVSSTTSSTLCSSMLSYFHSRHIIGSSALCCTSLVCMHDSSACCVMVDLFKRFNSDRCSGFVFFVTSLQKGHYKFQFTQFAWTHMALYLIVVQAHFVLNNILEGLIWLFLPSALVCTLYTESFVLLTLFLGHHE